MIYKPAEDSYLLEKEVKKYSKNRRVLDMGAGSGIQSKAALIGGAISLIATDKNPQAILDLRKKGIKGIQSDLFSDIEGKFDLIIFNPPYLPSDDREDSESRLTTTGGKRGDEIILRFLRSLKKHLANEGVSLIVLSSLTPKKKILSELKRQKLCYEVLSSQRFFFETLEVWEIKEKNKKPKGL